MIVLSSVERELLARCDTFDELEKNLCLHTLGYVQKKKSELEAAADCIEDLNSQLESYFDDARLLSIQRSYVDHRNMLMNSVSIGSASWWKNQIYSQLLGAGLTSVFVFILLIIMTWLNQR